MHFIHNVHIFILKYTNYRYKEWLKLMPSSDSAEAHVEQRGLLVPFLKELFLSAGCTDSGSVFQSLQATSEESTVLPTVLSTASVRWSGREGERNAVPYSRVYEETGIPAPDSRPSAASKRAEAKQLKRKQNIEAALRIKAGDQCYINLRAWPEYEEEYNYPSPLDKTFALGVYGGVVKGKGRMQIRKLDVPVFKISHEVDVDWIETWGLHSTLPDEGKPFTRNTTI